MSDALGSGRDVEGPTRWRHDPYRPLLELIDRDDFQRVMERAEKRPQWWVSEALVESAFREEHGSKLLHRMNEKSWYDLRTKNRNHAYQVKECTTEVGAGDGETEGGRFRVWQSQTNALLGKDSHQGHSAWYVFVLWGTDGRLIDGRRMRPETVSTIVSARDGWYESGHDDLGHQYKIPWQVILHPNAP